MLCEKVIIINKGKLVAIDTPQNLENKVSGSNSILVTVEDNENKIKNTIKQIDEIKDINLIKENDDNTRQYMLTATSDLDIRKIVFEKFAKEGITIFELKKSEITLEDAFIELIKDKGGNN